MTNLDPVAWLDRHPRLFKYVLYPTLTIVLWTGELLAADQTWKLVFFVGITLVNGMGILLMLMRLSDLFVARLTELAMYKRFARSFTTFHGMLISRGLWKHEPSKGKHKWNYMSGYSPANVYTLQAKLITE